jgi:cytoskeletal protein CcmA (bactofilin family)
MPDSLISEDLTIEGDLDADGGKVVVAGQITGDVTAHSVEVRKQGSVKGAVTAESVLIHGTQAGKISCSELTLSASSVVTSDVTAKSMISEKGAKLRGKIAIAGV